MSPFSNHARTYRFFEILALLVLVFPFFSVDEVSENWLSPGVLIPGAAALLVGFGLVHHPARKLSWVAIFIAGLVSTALHPNLVDGALLCIFAAFLLFDSGWFGRHTLLMAGVLGGSLLLTQVAALFLWSQESANTVSLVLFTDGLFLVLCLVFRRDLVSLTAVTRPTLIMTDFGLSPRERQIVHLVWGGESPRQIAAFLGVTDAAVRKSLSRVYSKVGVPGLKELGDLAHTHQVIWEESNESPEESPVKKN